MHNLHATKKGMYGYINCSEAVHISVSKAMASKHPQEMSGVIFHLHTSRWFAAMYIVGCEKLLEYKANQCHSFISLTQVICWSCLTPRL